MPRYDTGLVIGKFLPLHKGHVAMMRAAKAISEHLYVIVCHTEGYEIPAETRRAWIERECPRAQVSIIEHDKALDSASPSMAQQWANLTFSHLGMYPDVVVSSEDYGPAYAAWLGADHIMFDRERARFPISGTQIRENPRGHWGMLSYGAKAYYAKRVVVLGAESTGTTTLAMDLAKRLGTTWVPEYGRAFCEGKMFSGDASSWNEDDFVHIAWMQNASEDKLAETCREFLICDTDAFATSVWFTRYVGGRSERVEQLAEDRHPHLYIVTDPDIPFVQDGTRDGEHIRQWMHSYLLERLSATGREFIVVRGTRDERIDQSLVVLKCQTFCQACEAQPS